MAEREHNLDTEAKTTRVNPGYAALQLAKAFTTSQEHDDPATRERAREKIARWERVLNNVLSGAVDYGSRTPVEGAPAWATLEVVTGGFATGELLAGGPLQEHEQKLQDKLKGPEGEERRVLNAYFLGDEGLAELQERLQTGCYDVSIPEEGALLIVAWLVEHGYTEEARELVATLSPYLARLRFYPIPLEQPRQRFGSRVHVQDVGETIAALQRIKPHKSILAQKEAVEIWAPFYDRVVALFLETVENDWPCQRYAADWPERAIAILAEYAELRKEHQLCGKPERAREHFAQLREFLSRCAREPGSLTGREVGRIRFILSQYMNKRGAPDSPQCAAARRRQQRDVSAPTFHSIAQVVVQRLEEHPQREGLDDVSHLKQAITSEESANSGIPEGALIPAPIQQKVERCLNETVAALVERGLITSGETLARVLPQMTSGFAGIPDPTLRQAYAAIYRAFRRRRSLLLLNLEKQVQLAELPWIAAIERFRSDDVAERETARQTLADVTLLTIASFPHAIIPNKLIQELRALAESADRDIPLVNELAADIFMGKFSNTFLQATQVAAMLLEGTLYATYYGLDYEQIKPLIAQETIKQTYSWHKPKTGPDPFAQLCASRAGVSLGTWDPAINGMIIEQQQILTTQNLAALFVGLGLADELRGQLAGMAEQCFKWICTRQQVKTDRWHARLIMLKNTAYAWRQMIFFLALLPQRDVDAFLRRAEDHLSAQREDFQNRFRPALKGLALAAQGRSIASAPLQQPDARLFLGWSKAKHWLLTDVQD